MQQEILGLISSVNRSGVARALSERGGWEFAICASSFERETSLLSSVFDPELFQSPFGFQVQTAVVPMCFSESDGFVPYAAQATSDRSFSTSSLGRVFASTSGMHEYRHAVFSRSSTATTDTSALLWVVSQLRKEGFFLHEIECEVWAVSTTDISIDFKSEYWLGLRYPNLDPE
ncbi:MAG: hypothetical protein AAB668_00870 [Patescibacteria group bacterium]